MKKLPSLILMSSLVAGQAYADVVAPDQDEWLWKDVPVLKEPEQQQAQYNNGYSGDNGSSALMWYLLGSMHSPGHNVYYSGYHPGDYGRSYSGRTPTYRTPSYQKTKAIDATRYRQEQAQQKYKAQLAQQKAKAAAAQKSYTSKPSSYTSKPSSYSSSSRSGGWGSSGSRSFGSFGG